MNKDERLRAAVHRATNGYYMDAAQTYTHALEDAKLLCEALLECRRRRDEIASANEANKRNTAHVKTQLNAFRNDAIAKVRCLVGYVEFLDSKRQFAADEIPAVITEANEWLLAQEKPSQEQENEWISNQSGQKAGAQTLPRLVQMR